jgi:hypothetical protein
MDLDFFFDFFCQLEGATGWGVSQVPLSRSTCTSPAAFRARWISVKGL